MTDHNIMDHLTANAQQEQEQLFLQQQHVPQAHVSHLGGQLASLPPALLPSVK